MNKVFGSICLVAGTAMGAGMIALPMVLSKIGLINSVLLMMGTWFIMYISSLINIELNLTAKKGLALGELGRKFSGPIASVVGDVSLGLLGYSLLSAYIYGSISILEKLLESLFNTVIDFSFLSIITVACLFAILMTKIKLVDYVNRTLFLTMLALFGLLIVSMGVSLDISNLPLSVGKAHEISSWVICLPVLFTAFGFQIIFHTLTNYLDHDKQALKKAFFWGSLTPAIIYLLWIIAVLGLLYKHNPDFYQITLTQTIEAGELIQALSGITQWKHLKFFYWSVSLLAILTSAIGVALGVMDAWHQKLSYISDFPSKILKFLAICFTLLPAYLVAIIIPNAFIHALSFAGMVLTVIAIFLPLYLLYHIQKSKEQIIYAILKFKPILWITFLFGVLILGAEMINLFPAIMN